MDREVIVSEVEAVCEKLARVSIAEALCAISTNIRRAEDFIYEGDDPQVDYYLKEIAALCIVAMEVNR